MMLNHLQFFYMVRFLTCNELTEVYCSIFTKMLECSE